MVGAWRGREGEQSGGKVGACHGEGGMPWRGGLGGHLGDIVGGLWSSVRSKVRLADDAALPYSPCDIGISMATLPCTCAPTPSELLPGGREQWGQENRGQGGGCMHVCMG